MTFVNLDNDDNDPTLDTDATVATTDDELIRLRIEACVNTASIKMSAGTSAMIAIWTNAQKTGVYAFGTLLPLTNSGNGIYSADLWIETK